MCLQESSRKIRQCSRECARNGLVKVLRVCFHLFCFSARWRKLMEKKEDRQLLDRFLFISLPCKWGLRFRIGSPNAPPNRSLHIELIIGANLSCVSLRLALCALFLSPHPLAISDFPLPAAHPFLRDILQDPRSFSPLLPLPCPSLLVCRSSLTLLGPSHRTPSPLGHCSWMV